jgi:hypothetical protein
VHSVMGSGTVMGAHHHRLGEDDIVTDLGMASWAWGRCLRGQWHHRLGLGKMAERKGA